MKPARTRLAVRRGGIPGALRGAEGVLPGDAAVRAAAAEAFRRRGLPGAREEAWHFTNLRLLAETPFRGAAAAARRCCSAGCRRSTRRAWCSSNGRFRRRLSMLPHDRPRCAPARPPSAVWRGRRTKNSSR